MAGQATEEGGMSPQLKNTLIIAAIIVAVLLAVWSAVNATRGPREQIVGSLEGMSNKGDSMRGQQNTIPAAQDPSIPHGGKPTR